MELKIIRDESFNDIGRNERKKFIEKFWEVKRRMFEDLEYSYEGWESCGQALERFKEGIGKVDKKYEKRRS